MPPMVRSMVCSLETPTPTPGTIPGSWLSPLRILLEIMMSNRERCHLGKSFIFFEKFIHTLG